VAVRPHGYETASAADVALDARVVSVGIWLFLAADAFFFAGWYFAFFYLRALNNNQAWIIDGLTRPNRGYGTVVMLLVVLSAASYYVASRAAGTKSMTWAVLAPVALVLGLAACLFQGYEMWHLGFGLTQGGYPSVFSGLTGSWVVHLAFAMAWLAGIVVQSRPDRDTVLRSGPATSFSGILLFLAGMGVISFILLYLVA
jgi:heme/copper-type cytochrome/quinol oxidase subunit 3